MTRLDGAINDVRYILNCLETLRNIWETGRDCNTCTATCKYRQWGRQVTYNCPLWEGDSDVKH